MQYKKKYNIKNYNIKDYNIKISSYKSNSEVNDTFIRILEIIIGILLVIIFVPLFLKNEMTSLKNYKAMKFASENIIETAVDCIEEKNEGKLVHFCGMTSSDDTITDEKFNISINNSLSLNRVVEMYQWKEISHRHKKNKEIYYTYTHEKVWSSNLIDSNNFHERNGHENPKAFPCVSANYPAKNINIGAYKIPSSHICLLGSPVNVDIESLNVTLPSKYAILKENKIFMNVFEEEMHLKEKEEYNTRLNNRHNNRYNNKRSNNNYNNNYKPNGFSSPQIGDVKIYFTRYPFCEATIIGVQNGNIIRQFNNDECSIFEARCGKIPAEKIIRNYENQNTVFLWLFRIIYFIMLVVGFGLIIDFISIIDIPGISIEFRLGVFPLALNVTFLICTVIISYIWFFTRPFIGIIALVLGLLSLFEFIKNTFF